MQNIHPYFVHFPIAILSVGLLWDLLGILLKKESFKNAGWWAQVFGVIAIVITVTTGLIAANTVPHNEASHEIMETHETIGLIVAGAFILLLIWRSFLKTSLPLRKSYQTIYLAIGILAVVTMLYGAHLGGKLVYEFGVGGSAVQQSAHTHQHTETNEEHGHESDPDSSGESEHQH
ncbi:MAG: DUF2231 domain-containing protein [Ignavibacteriales bacterium]|nr:DUF2231 domain-containing protein [Ignavibacteriales bacterium]